jgi:hypothetical protein
MVAYGLLRSRQAADDALHCRDSTADLFRDPELAQARSVKLGNAALHVAVHARPAERLPHNGVRFTFSARCASLKLNLLPLVTPLWCGRTFSKYRSEPDPVIPIGSVGAEATAVLAGVPSPTPVAGPTAPSFRPGPYAGESIPAASTAQKFSTAERAAIDKIGKETGCHTCGATSPGTKSGHFVPDHQPVSSLNSAGAPQRLYPQCIDCIRQQGLDAARELRKK